MNPYDAEIKALLNQLVTFRTALVAIAAADPGPASWHINGVYVGRIAREALATQEAHP